jgi:Fur family ferric uptake transcriptional regulator
MTVPRLAVPAPAGDLDAAIAALRARGLRLSASRRLVLEALYAVGRPVTAEEIACGMYGRLPRCDLASVYRNLDTLEELGLVRHMHLGHGPGLYAPASDDDEYIACERCGRSEAVTHDILALVRAAVREAVGYEPRFNHFPLTGLCPSCKEKLGAQRR